MSKPFELASRIFDNARKFRIDSHVLVDFGPVDELVKESGLWFSALAEEDEDYARSIRMKVWLLRTTVIHSLLPFDCEDLRLDEQLEGLMRETSTLPFLAERMERLTKMVKFLIDNPVNPKREKVFELLRDCPHGGREVGLVTGLTRWPTPGWSGIIVNQIREAAPACELIASVKMLRSGIYHRIILPSGGRLSPLLYILHHGCRTERLDVVFYKREGDSVPEKKSLPKGSFTKFATSRTKQASQYETDARVDESVVEGFWKSIRETIEKEKPAGIPETDLQFLVRARLLILANNTRVFLRDDMHVMEISDIIEGRSSIEEYGRRFPRRLVSELEEGDLIVLRTSGSGDYLEEVANHLMQVDGREELTSALDWKRVLKEALEEYGSNRINAGLREKGHILDNHRYIWIWTTDQVIRPGKESLYSDLIKVLYNLGHRLGEDDPREAAQSRWVRMKTIVRYRVMAGRKIRQALLHRLREMIVAGIQITDSYHLTLPEVRAGELSIFRVAAVYSETEDIPYSHAGVIKALHKESPGLERLQLNLFPRD